MTDLPAELRAELVEAAANSILRAYTRDTGWPGFMKMADAAFDAIVPRLVEHVAGQVREDIAAASRGLRVEEEHGDGFGYGWNGALDEIDAVLARSSRPVVTESVIYSKDVRPGETFEFGDGVIARSIEDRPVVTPENQR